MKSGRSREPKKWAFLLTARHTVLVPTATQSTSRDYHSLLKHESETESVPLSLLMNTGRHLARMHGRAI